jgi:hypothetical protein
MTERNDDNSAAWNYTPLKDFAGICSCGASQIWDDKEIGCSNEHCDVPRISVEGIIKDLKLLAMRYYNHGGDRYVECFDRSDWMQWLQDFGYTARATLIHSMGVQELEGQNLKGLYFVQVHGDDGVHQLGSKLTLEEALNKAKEFSEYAYNQFTPLNMSAVTMYGSILEVCAHDNYIE